MIFVFTGLWFAAQQTMSGFPLVSYITRISFPSKDSCGSWIFECEKFTTSDYYMYIATGYIKNQHRPSNAVRSSTRTQQELLQWKKPKVVGAWVTDILCLFI